MRLRQAMAPVLVLLLLAAAASTQAATEAAKLPHGVDSATSSLLAATVEAALPEPVLLSPEETAEALKRIEAAHNAGGVVTTTVPESESPISAHDAVFMGDGKKQSLTLEFGTQPSTSGISPMLRCKSYFSTEYRSVQTKLTWWVEPTECDAGVIVLGATVEWFKANVNAPRTRYATTDEDFSCHWWNNWCRTPLTSSSHRIYSTQYTSAKLTVCMTIPNGSPQCVQGWSDDHAYPDSGARYPVFTDSRGGGPAIFPGAPYNGWNRCADNRNAAPPCARDTSFRQNVINFHTMMGWRVPGSSYDAHHDIPLCKGGGNSASNGMFVYYLFHRGELHSWWRGFITTRTGRPSATEAERIAYDQASGIKPDACLDSDD